MLSCILQNFASWLEDIYIFLKQCMMHLHVLDTNEAAIQRGRQAANDEGISWNKPTHSVTTLP